MVETRIFPMNKAEGFVPAIQRYSARLPKDVEAVQVVHLGVQSRSGDAASCLDVLRQLEELFSSANGPIHHDYAKYIDPQGCLTMFAVAYWRDPAQYGFWRQSSPVSVWWSDTAKEDGDLGYFREAMFVNVDHAETIAFKEYIRGLSACPMSRIEAMGESGYWGAARDRIPASAVDRLETSCKASLKHDPERHHGEMRIAIRPPDNFTVIRSGVSWQDCGEEQLTSYMQNVKPKLDAGMEFLRTNSVESGCCTIRQSDVISPAGEELKESFVVGHFRSLEDLETWSREHPTHLAIFARAMAERKKYGERLELRTYHEVFLLDGSKSLFEYVNCHPETGLLAWSDSTGGG